MNVIDAIKEVAPNAEPNWAGRPDEDSFVLEWGDSHLVCTRWSGPDEYDLGLYGPGQWLDGYLPLVLALVPAGHDAPQRLAQIVDELTELPSDDWIQHAENYMRHRLGAQPVG